MQNTPLADFDSREKKSAKVYLAVGQSRLLSASNAGWKKEEKRVREQG
jgi:hypothetical protein